VLGVIKRHFKYITPETLILLYKSMVRTHIEYGHSVWCPYSVTAIESLEKVQKRATKLIHGLQSWVTVKDYGNVSCQHWNIEE